MFHMKFPMKFHKGFALVLYHRLELWEFHVFLSPFMADLIMVSLDV